MLSSRHQSKCTNTKEDTETISPLLLGKVPHAKVTRLIHFNRPYAATHVHHKTEWPRRATSALKCVSMLWYESHRPMTALCPDHTCQERVSRAPGRCLDLRPAGWVEPSISRGLLVARISNSGLDSEKTYVTYKSSTSYQEKINVHCLLIKCHGIRNCPRA